MLLMDVLVSPPLPEKVHRWLLENQLDNIDSTTILRLLRLLQRLICIPQKLIETPNFNLQIYYTLSPTLNISPTKTDY